MKNFRYVKVGDTVKRRMGADGPLMEMVVVTVDDTFIYCGNRASGIGMTPDGPEGWKFDRTYGYEVDEELGWGILRGPDTITGSYLEHPSFKRGWRVTKSFTK